MASRKLPQSQGQISNDPEDWHVAEVCDPCKEARALPIPTGLSDEADAANLLAIQFTGLFCVNCETYYDMSNGEFCPACTMRLRPVGTRPIRLKQSIR